MVYYQFKESTKAVAFSKTPFQKAAAIVNILAERYLAKGLLKGLKPLFHYSGLAGRSANTRH
jgi:hypothetical protein